MDLRHEATGTAGALALVGLCVFATGACSSHPASDARPTDTGFALAYVHDDCAPWDGAALTIVLTQVVMDDPFATAFPHARITSYRPPSRLAGSSLDWSGPGHDEGYAAACDSAGACTPATGVELRFDGEQPDPARLRGILYMELEDGRVIGGPFDARPLAFTALCG